MLNVLFSNLKNNEPISVLQSIDKKFIITVLILLLVSTSKSLGINLDNINTKAGVISLMYHRFDENKYPSTNIRMEIFKQQLSEIDKEKIEFITFNKFEKIIKNNIEKNYLLLTIDDGFKSFQFAIFFIYRESGKFKKIFSYIDCTRMLPKSEFKIKI